MSSEPLHRKDVLPNGVRVISVETPHLRSAMIAVYVRAGSRHENADRMGVSHFLEHMFFRGSKKHPDTVQMNALVEGAGGNLNGVTTRDHGYYYTPIAPGELDVGFDVLGDMLCDPLLVELETERQIILEEMLDEVDETGRDIDLDNLSKMALFDGHGLSHKIAGTPRTVKRITIDDIRGHHDRMYRGGNIVVACAGPVNHAQVMELAARAFGRLPPGIGPSEVTAPPSGPGPTVLLVDHEDSPQTELRFNFPAPPEHHADFPALLLARRVLDDGLSSRLPFEVVEKRGLAYALHAGIDTFSDVSIFEVEAATSHEKVPKVIQSVAEVLARLVDAGPTDEELARAKKRHKISLEFAMDSPAELAGWFGGTELWRPAEGFAERIARVEAVSSLDLRRVTAAVFARSNLQMTLVGRGGGRAETRLRRLASELPLPLRS